MMKSPGPAHARAAPLIDSMTRCMSRERPGLASFHNLSIPRNPCMSMRHPFGFSGQPGEDALGTMSAEELRAWENRDVPSIARVSDHVEARADEKQDVTTSLSFPLHWTSAKESWD